MSFKHITIFFAQDGIILTQVYLNWEGSERTLRKHAYLIMAHHRPDLLRLLLNALDDVRNDIYLHIDKKCEINNFDLKVKASRLVLIDRMDITWASYSQVECEYTLFDEAFKHGPYEYYHLLTGASYPLCNQDEMHRFFEDNSGYEFIGFDEKNDYSFRARNIILFSEMGKPDTKVKILKYRLRNVFLSIQQAAKYNRLKKYPNLNAYVIKKGLAYVSVTNDFVSLLLKNRGDVEKLLNHSVSGDEVFIQTIAYNSQFKDKIYDLEDEFEGAMREVTWDDRFGIRDGHNFTINDLDFLLKSKKKFALKFEGKDGVRLINEIKRHKNIG